MKSDRFQSTHKLDFEASPWVSPITTDETWMKFKVGTCHGVYHTGEHKGVKHYAITAIMNGCPGNGHFDDVLEWFYHSCLRDHYDLVIEELCNEELSAHLRKKRGFSFINGKSDYVIKPFRKIKT